MKKYVVGLAIVSLLAIGGCSTKDQNSNANMNPRLIAPSAEGVNMLDEARNAVVGISVQYDDGYAIGSGVAVVDGSLILTNNHVIDGGDDITLYLADETTTGADVLWSDSALDMAVLKSDRRIPYLAFSSSKDAQIGEEVFAIGTPLTLQFKHTVTKGIVSAKDRVLQVEGETGYTYMQSLLQHDASINPGNSGGPLVNSNGQILGINTLKVSEGEGLGFAVPIEIGQKIAIRLSENENYQVPFFGVFGFDSEIAKVYGYDLSEKGVFVISVSGPALDAGFQKGDLIVGFGDSQIESMLDLRLALFEHDVSDEVVVTIIRDGTVIEKSVTLGQR